MYMFNSAIIQHYKSWYGRRPQFHAIPVTPVFPYCYVYKGCLTLSSGNLLWRTPTMCRSRMNRYSVLAGSLSCAAFDHNNVHGI